MRKALLYLSLAASLLASACNRSIETEHKGDPYICEINTFSLWIGDTSSLIVQRKGETIKVKGTYRRSTEDAVHGIYDSDLTPTQFRDYVEACEPILVANYPRRD